MQTTTFTSTISPALISWLDVQARREKRTRRDMLEEALITLKRTKMREGFARVAKDADLVEIAEWGMDEYSRMANKL